MEVGKLPVNVLRQSVLSQLHTQKNTNGAGLGKDCAVFSLPENCELATCMQEAELSDEGAEAVFTLADDGVAHGILRCANNLAAGGALPLGFSLTVFLPEGTDYPELKAILQSADKAAASMQATIFGGQTRVTKAVTSPLLVIAGYGTRRKGILSGAKPGEAVILTKTIGLEGTAVLARKNKELIGSRYPAYLAREAAEYFSLLSVLPEAAVAASSGASALHDASEGGIFAALWEMAEGAGVGLDIELKKIPILQETVEIADICEANPYELLSGGCLVIISPDGEGMVRELTKAGIEAAIVGFTTEEKKKIIRNGEEIRYMDRPAPDALTEGSMEEKS